MSYGNTGSNNSNYNEKKRSGGGGKSAYEIRTDVLKLAMELHNVNSSSKGEEIDPVKVIETATKFNDFISKKNDR